MFDITAFKLICGFLGILIFAFVVLFVSSYFQVSIDADNAAGGEMVKGI